MATSAKGNAPKYESYIEAWNRIRASQDAGFYLEAITLEESIISDRLISFLSRSTSPNPLTKDKRGQWPGFGMLIGRLRQEFPGGVQIEGIGNLVEALDVWRKMRNTAIHSLAKSDPGTPTVDVRAFLRKARAAAKRGSKLAIAVSRWQKRAARPRRVVPIRAAASSRPSQ